MKKPTCSVDACESASKNCGMCWTHYKRRLKGLPMKPPPLECAFCHADFIRPNVTGVSPKFCSGTCKSQATRRAGAPENSCLGCGGAVPFRARGRALKYCTPQCRKLFYAHQGRRPRVKECTTCGASIDLATRMADGRLRHASSVSLCASCSAKKRPHRYGMTAAQIADRDGYSCKWCGATVDFELVGTRNKLAPSVDHITPWSRGGTNHPDNLQLLHRKCNAEKGVRMPA